jgi:chemotaxis protein MotB
MNEPMDDKHPEIIIIKRHSSHEEEHHGGAWKIAFADFMTAMMAFFLVLWIINATDKNTKTIIARYFNPLKLEDMAKAQKGIRLPVGDEARQTKPIDDDTPKKQEEPGPTSGEADKKEPAAKDGGKQDKQDKQDKQSKETVDPAQPKAHLSETALLGDPYASLDKIAGKVTTTESPKVGAAAGSSPTQEPAQLDLDAFVDPFKPVARGTPTDSLVAADPEATQQSTPPTPDAQGRPQAAPAPQPEPSVANAPAHPDANGREPPAPPPVAQSAEAERPAAAAAAEAAKPPVAAEAAKLQAVSEAAKLQGELLKELHAEIHAQPAPGIEVQATSEGILISLTDEFNFGMFAVGSSEPQPKVVRIMEKIAEMLKSRPGPIVLRGHTDARPYKGVGYDNWRLSSARAQMAYYMLIRGGLDEKRVERIEGYADRRLKTPDKPEAAENRRIEILLRKDKS